jgi:hypothetical protein
MPALAAAFSINISKPSAIIIIRYNAQHARQIVAEYIQRHFGRHVVQALHQKVCHRAPPQRGERMLDRFAAHAHRLWVLVEPRLHRFDNMLALPPPYAALIARRAPILEPR